MLKNILKSHGIAIALIIGIGLLPFLSYLFSNQSLYASDQIGSLGWKFYFDALKQGELPFWNPYALSGMPTFDAMFGDASYPLFILLGLFVPVTYLVGHMLVLHVLIAGITTYTLIYRFFKLDKWLSTVLAVCYMLNTNFISHIHAGHTGKFYIMAWLPLGLFFLLRLLSTKAKWYHALGLSLNVALYISTSHLQFTYFVLMGFFLYYAFKLVFVIKEKKWKSILPLSLKFWVPILLGVGIAFPIFYPPIKYNEAYSVRGTGDKQTYEHATSWSIHPEELASFIIPEFTGINNKYWGRNIFKLNSEYPGFALIIISFFGLWLFRRKWMWYWLALSVLSAIFALGANTPIFRLFYHFVPGIKSFRAPGMILFWFTLSGLMLSAHTLYELFYKRSEVIPEKRIQQLKKIILGVGGILLTFCLIPDLAFGIWNTVFSTEVFSNFSKQAGSIPDFRLGAIRAFLLFSVIAGGIWAWGIKSSNKKNLAILLLVAVTLDLIIVNNSFIKTYDSNLYFPKTSILSTLEKEKEEFRVFGLPRAYTRGYMQAFGYQDIGGFIDNEYTLYREFRGSPYQANPNFMKNLVQSADGRISGSKALDMLNVKYLIAKNPKNGRMILAPNKSYLPRAFFVENWEFQKDENILHLVLDKNYLPKEKVYISDQFRQKITASPIQDTVPAITSISKTINRINTKQYQVNTNKPGILFLSEVYFPHWTVQVDGKATTLLKVNHLFQGVYLDAGKHDVKIMYTSPWLYFSLKVAILSLILLIAFIFYLRYTNRKTKGL